MLRNFSKSMGLHQFRSTLAVGGLFFFVGLSLLTTVQAGDWPQIMGPTRSGIAAGEKLFSQWPEDGPALLWSRPVGRSIAGVAVQGEIGVLFHRLDDREVIEAFNVTNGDSLWKTSYPTSFIPSIGTEDGPLCVPTIDGPQVVTFGPKGVLTCCDLKSGEQQWQRDTHGDFAALAGYFGAGSSPLVLNDRVIVNVGGHKTEAGIVAFDRKTGETLWHVTNERASYAAPILSTVAGQPTIICAARTLCLGLNPDDGAIRFDVPFGKPGPTVNAALPIVLDDRLFLTASYSIGAVSARLSADGADELWRRRDSLASQYTTPVAHHGVLYAIDGREDGPAADLVCLDPTTGDRLWAERAFGYATLIGSGDKLLVVKTDGEIVLINADRDQFSPISRHRVTNKVMRALPALSNGRLYVRDTKTLFCISVGDVE